MAHALAWIQPTKEAVGVGPVVVRSGAEEPEPDEPEEPEEPEPDEPEETP